MSKTEDTLRARFLELGRAKKQLVETEVGPLREKLDGMIAEIREIEAKMAPVDAEYRAAREKLVPLDKEMALITRALAGGNRVANTGPQH